MESERQVDELLMLYSKLNYPMEESIPDFVEPEHTLRELIAAKKFLVQQRLGISDELLEFVHWL